MSLDCPCEFGPRYELGAFSPEWHRQHRDHHLAVFPDVDQNTRDNLTAVAEYPLHHPATALANYRAGREMWDTNGDLW